MSTCLECGMPEGHHAEWCSGRTVSVTLQDDLSDLSRGPAFDSLQRATAEVPGFAPESRNANKLLVKTLLFLFSPVLVVIPFGLLTQVVPGDSWVVTVPGCFLGTAAFGLFAYSFVLLPQVGHLQQQRHVGNYVDYLEPHLLEGERILAVTRAETKPKDHLVVKTKRVCYLVFTTHRLIKIGLQGGIKWLVKNEGTYHQKGEMEQVVGSIETLDYSDRDQVRSEKLWWPFLTQVSLRRSDGGWDGWRTPSFTDNGRKIAQLLQRAQGGLGG